jgi:beta-barrel assembly-enhancing protease
MNRFLGAVLALAAAQAQQQEPGKGVNFYSREKEIALGQALAREFRSKTTPLGDAGALEYVQRVGAKLAAQFPGGWPYEFDVVREETGLTHEPAAFPGGSIFVSRALLGASRNEAEFAGMLAHAMAHVVARHATHQASKADLMQKGTAPTGNWMTGSGLQVPLSLIPFQGANEREADYLAVRAMAAAGYDPAALASYIEREQPAEPAVSKVFSQLPDKQQRLAAIRDEIRR